MRSYIALIRQRMIALLQFRVAFFSKITVHIFWGYVRAAIILAYYVYGEGSARIDVRQAIAMIWLVQAAQTLLPGIAMDMNVWEKIRTGDVGYELLRPLDLYGNWYASAIAAKLSPFLIEVGPTILVALITPGNFALMPPASALHLVCCVVALMTGLTLSCAAICLSYAMAMDVRVGIEPARFFLFFVQMMAGVLLPLQLWPEGMQRFLEWQPFAAAMDLPFRLYTGSAAPGDLWQIVMKQFLWAGAMIAIGRFWIHRNLKKLVIQGG